MGNCNRHTKQPKARSTKRFRRVKVETSLPSKRIHIKMGEESGYSWFCWRRSPAYAAAGKTDPELNPSPLLRASGTVLVELVELPMGPFSISTTTGGNNNGNCKELSNESHSSSSTSTGTEKRLSPVSSSLSIHPSISSSMSSISSNSSSSLPPYSELVKELGTL